MRRKPRAGRLATLRRRLATLRRRLAMPPCTAEATAKEGSLSLGEGAREGVGAAGCVLAGLESWPHGLGFDVATGVGGTRVARCRLCADRPGGGGAGLAPRPSSSGRGPPARLGSCGGAMDRPGPSYRDGVDRCFDRPDGRDPRFLLLVEARRGRLGLGPALIAAGLSLALSVAAPVLLSRDVYSYAAYGRMYALHHANPYVRMPSAFPSDPFVAMSSPAWIGTRAVYGPAFVLAGAGVARAWAGSPGVTITAFKVLAGTGAALATVLAAWAAARSIRHRGAPAPPERSRGSVALAAAAVGLNPVIVVHTVGGGHNDAMIAACLAGALVLAG